MPGPVPIRRRALAAGIGLFCLWQMVYLPAANVIDFVPAGCPRAT